MLTVITDLAMERSMAGSENNSDGNTVPNQTQKCLQDNRFRIHQDRLRKKTRVSRGGASFQKVGWTRGKINCQKVYVMFFISLLHMNKC